MLEADDIAKIDRSRMIDLLLNFPAQFEEAIRIGEQADIALARNKIANIVFAGMGGSAIGGNVIIDVVKDQLHLPAFVNRNYYLPQFVDGNSLVFISSFSGNTEESLGCFQDAIDKEAQIVCITSGGKLQNLAREKGVPAIQIPGGMPPRCALGYLSVPLMQILSKAGICKIQQSDFQETLSLLRDLSAEYAPSAADNLAWKIANQLTGKIPIIYTTADFLSSAALRWKTQFSENAKLLAFVNVFPELNHNEIVGWQQLPNLLNSFQVIYLQDHEDFERNKIRMSITKSIIEKHTNPIIELQTKGNSRLARIFSLIFLGDMISFYLAMLNHVDPTPIENIKILKRELSKMT